MSGERNAELARRWIRRTRPEAPPRLPGDRRRLVSAVEGALRTRRRKRTIIRSVGTLTAAAAVVALVSTRLEVIGLRNQAQAPIAHNQAGKSAPDVRALTVLGASGEGNGAIALGNDVVRPVKRGMMLQPGIELVAPESGDVQIGTAQGTLLTLEPGGTLTVTEATETQRFALLRGAVRARVAKLAPGERFLINSADAEIEVHGTQFRVALTEPDPGCADGSRTRVSVTEGVVSVRSAGKEVRLHPGEEWPTGCATPVRHVSQASRPARVAHRSKVERAASVETAPSEAPAPTATGTTAPTAKADIAASPRVLVMPPPEPSSVAAAQRQQNVSSPQTPGSQLAVQNDLFAAAMRAKKAGRDTEAIRFLTRLVRRYPDGPLAESALAQRMKLMAAGDQYAGANAALEYLSLYPDGFAKADAERLAARAMATKP